jgi:hypothetical protein
MAARSGAHWLTIAGDDRDGSDQPGHNRGEDDPLGMFFPMDSIAVEPATITDTMGAEVDRPA